MRFLITIVLFMTATTLTANELTFGFKSPAFSGIGYSSHVLTLEQLETNRKQKIKDDEQAAIEKAERDYKSTNAYKFKNNLESRVYATLSKQIADSMFDETDAWLELTEYGYGTIITYNGKQYKSTTNLNTSTPGSEGANSCCSTTPSVSSCLAAGMRVRYISSIISKLNTPINRTG